MTRSKVVPFGLSAFGLLLAFASLALLPAQDITCNGPIVDGACTIDGKKSGIIITPGTTTIASPGLKVYTTPLGIPCGEAFPMPGCLPAEMQGWLVQIEGGDEQFFDVAFTYLDTEGKEHTVEEARIPRQPSFQGKPSFTVAAFRVGRAKNAFFPVGTTAVRTVVAHYTPKVAASVEHEQR